MAKSGDKSLKSINQPKLITFVVVNVILVAVAIVGYGKTVMMIREIAGGNLQVLVRLIGFPAAAGLALGVLSWFVPKPWKETLVFWRVGPHRLPSSEAFSRIAPVDSRIDKARLEARLGKLPSDRREQSALWYSVYRKYSKDIPVIDAHAAYLLYREMTALIPILLLAIIVCGWVVRASLGRIVIVSILVVVEGLIISLAARNAGTRLVSNVLAIEAANSGSATSFDVVSLGQEE
jgi:hypothetical protein